jgi:hypothetical protein
MKRYSQQLCTKYHDPFEENSTRTQQHFARMWFDLLVDSPFVTDMLKGVSDPYSWTSGNGCGYELGYSRFSYTDQDEYTILRNASSQLYNIDEGVELGVIDRTALIGDVFPPIGEYSFDNPLEHVGLLQTIYIALVAADIVERVKHKNRPGGPVSITEDDGRQLLAMFKESFESIWTEGWDDDGGTAVQFVGFFDDTEVPGTIGAFLEGITTSSALLTGTSIIVTAVFSVVFLYRRNPIKSRTGIALIGVVLIILALLASVGLGILIGIKVNLTIAWTLPFISKHIICVTSMLLTHCLLAYLTNCCRFPQTVIGIGVENVSPRTWSHDKHPSQFAHDIYSSTMFLLQYRYTSFSCLCRSKTIFLRKASCAE